MKQCNNILSNDKCDICTTYYLLIYLITFNSSRDKSYYTLLFSKNVLIYYVFI